MRKLYLLIIGIVTTFIFIGCGVNMQPMQVKTNSGYTAHADNYKVDEKTTSKDIVFIAIHGKGTPVNHPRLTSLYTSLLDNGYETIALEMPWSTNWSGTFEEGLALIDATINNVIASGRKPILIGHSLGAAASLIYVGKNPNNKLLGVIAIAPGHMLHNSNKMQKVTASSVEKAKTLISESKGNVRSSFKELNNGKIRNVTMSAEAYKSYYDTDSFPNVEMLLGDINTPTLWIAGKSDRLTKVYSMSVLFTELAQNSKNKYVLVDGNHTDVVQNSSGTVINWVSGL